MSSQNNLDNLSLKKLLKLKQEADEAYTNTDSPIFSDIEYDGLVELIKKKDPNYVKSVGVTPRENRVTLPIWLGSVTTFKPQDEKKITQWYSKMNKFATPKTLLSTDTLYYGEEKLDGISALYNIQTHQLFTRGDGVIGSDISHILPYINLRPAKQSAELFGRKVTKLLSRVTKDNLLPHLTDFVRGELVISKSIFETKYKNEYSKSRNMVSGAVNRKTITPQLQDIDFVAYETIDMTHNGAFKGRPNSEPVKQTGHHAQLLVLRSMGFKTVNDVYLENLSLDTLTTALYNARDTSEYEIDGLIVNTSKCYERNTTGDPNYMIAFKIDNDFVTTVTDVVWKPSRYGLLIPVAHITPLEISGAIIKKVSCHSASFVVENGIGIGSEVVLIRSGEVIPKIVRVTKKMDPKFPDCSYVWNEAHSNIMTCGSIDPLQEIKKIAHVFSTLKVKHVSALTIKKMYEAGYTDIFQVLGMSKADMLKIKTFQSKTVERIYDIHYQLANSPLSRTASAFGYLGDGFSETKILHLLQQIPQLFGKAIVTESAITAIAGFSKKTATKILDNLKHARETHSRVQEFIMNYLGTVSLISHKNKPPPSANTVKRETTVIIEDCPHELLSPQENSKSEYVPNIDSYYTGKFFVFSGFRNAELQRTIEDNGGSVMNGVSKTTSELIIKNAEDSETTKVKKARQMGIKVTVLSDFMRQHCV